MFPAEPAAPPRNRARLPACHSGVRGGRPAVHPVPAAAMRQASRWQPAEGGPPRPARRCRCPRAAAPSGTSGRSSRSARPPAPRSLTVPVATSPGRAGFGPSLSLSYDSGSGNGPFGLGWKLALPAITRKTDKGLPRYARRPGRRHVPAVRRRGPGPDPGRAGRRLAGGTRPADRGRPRLPGPGLPAPGRGAVRADRALAGPGHRRDALAHDHQRQRHHDLRRDRGQPHRRPRRPGAGVQLADQRDLRRHRQRRASTTTWPRTARASTTARPSERNRTARSRSANRYLKRIRYGNREPWRPGIGAIRSGPGPRRRLALRDRPRLRRPPGGRPAARARPALAGPQRPVLHLPARLRGAHLPPVPPGAHVPPLPRRARRRRGLPGVLHRPDLRQHRRQRHDDGGIGDPHRLPAPGRRLPHASLPPLELRYSPAVIGTEVRDLSPEALANLPAGVDGTAYQWVDLDGEGLSGILARQGGAWYYQREPRRRAGSRRRDMLADPARDGRRAAHGRNCSTSPATGTWTWPSSAARCPAATSGRKPTAGSRSARSGPARTSPGTTPTCAWSTWTGTASPTC